MEGYHNILLVLYLILDIGRNRIAGRLASVAGAVIQAIGRPEFEDGLRTGVQLVLRSGLQRVCTNLWSKMAGLMGLA